MTMMDEGATPHALKVMKQTETLPWVEKYRPASLADVVAHAEIVGTISRFIDENKLPHLLFYGPPGTGKTSTILACAKKIYGTSQQGMVLELNASDERGIDVVREQIKDFASTKKLFSTGYKLVILDEADAMTNEAQAALRRVIEKHTRNVRFCLICNYINKITPALQSRCTRFRFAPLDSSQISSKLDEVIMREGVVADEEGKKALTRLAAGDMRKALNILQSTFLASGIISEDSVYSCTGSPRPSDIKLLLEILLRDDLRTSLLACQKIKDARGLALADIVTEIHKYVLRLQLPGPMRISLINALCDIEFRLTSGASEKLQMSSMISAFALARSS